LERQRGAQLRQIERAVTIEINETDPLRSRLPFVQGGEEGDG
jgi:hypothetical protein